MSRISEELKWPIVGGLIAAIPGAMFGSFMKSEAPKPVYDSRPEYVKNLHASYETIPRSHLARDSWLRGSLVNAPGKELLTTINLPPVEGCQSIAVGTRIYLKAFVMNDMHSDANFGSYFGLIGLPKGMCNGKYDHDLVEVPEQYLPLKHNSVPSF